MQIDLSAEEDTPPGGLLSRLSLALGLQYNVILLLGAASFSLALASPLPLEAAAIAEALWLAVAVGFSGPSRWIRKHNQLASESAVTAGQALDAGYRHRGSVLGQMIEGIRLAGRGNGNLSRGDLRSAVSRLESIREAFLRFAGTHQRLSRFLGALQSANIDAEMARITDALSFEKDPAVKMGLRQALALGQRRAHQRDQVLSVLRSIDVQMSSIETAGAYIGSIAGTASSGRDIHSEIDALVARVPPADVVDAQAGSVIASAALEPAFRPLPG